MGLLLYRGDGLPAQSVVEPIYLTSPMNNEHGTTFTFEVLEDDAGTLLLLIGEQRYYILDSVTFWGRLEFLGAMSKHTSDAFDGKSLTR